MIQPLLPTSNSNPNPRKICLVISSLGPGGAERVVSIMANYWVEHGRQVEIVTLSNQSSFYKLSGAVRHRKLGLLLPATNPLHGLVNTLRRVVKLRREINRISPHLVISFMDKTNVLTLLASTGLRPPVIVSERIFPGTYDVGRGWHLLRRLSYRSARYVVAVTERMRSKLREMGFSGIQVIPNPVSTPPAIEGLNHLNSGRHTILGAGRFCNQKGFDVLIRAFAMVHKRHPEWRLKIIGDGDDRAYLERMVAECSVESNVDLPGFARDIYPELASAGIFVLSSRNEGFPNVLVEAMSVGVAVLATDCESGPNEIITHDQDGLLTPVDDVAQMAKAICRLIEDPELRLRLGEAAKAVATRYSLESVMAQWDGLVE